MVLLLANLLDARGVARPASPSPSPSPSAGGSTDFAGPGARIRNTAHSGARMLWGAAWGRVARTAPPSAALSCVTVGIWCEFTPVSSAAEKLKLPSVRCACACACARAFVKGICARGTFSRTGHCRRLNHQAAFLKGAMHNATSRAKAARIMDLPGATANMVSKPYNTRSLPIVSKWRQTS